MQYFVSFSRLKLYPRRGVFVVYTSRYKMNMYTRVLIVIKHISSDKARITNINLFKSTCVITSTRSID